MPTYQYTCTDCGEPLEAVQKFSDDPLTMCPACGGKLRKVFSPVGIVFKGSGFYRTDSRNGSSAPVPSKAKETADTSASNGSSDTKTAETKKSEPAASTSSSSSSTSAVSSSSASKSGEKAA